MNNDLKLAMNSEQSSGPDFAQPKKKSGCGCLGGCLGILILMLSPFIFSWVYVASLSDEEMGEKVIGVLADQSYADDVRDLINNSSEMSADEKANLLGMYESLLSKYHGLPPQQQAIIHKNSVKVVKMFFSEKGKIANEPPEELLQILDILAIAPNAFSNQSTVTDTSVSTATATETSTDPFGFGTSTPVTQTDTATYTEPLISTPTSASTATGTGYKTDYDF